MANNEVIQIDIDAVLARRLPRLSRFIPRAAAGWLKRTICQDRLNQLLRENAGLKGADFARGALRSLGITTEVRDAELLPPPSRRRVLYVSNHPLGGLDGMALIDMVQRHHGGRVYFVVNDLLSAVEPLNDVFLPINKFGKQSRDAARAIEDAFAGDDPIIMFPAGLVSRLMKQPGSRRKVVADLPWNKMFVNRAARYRRDIIPLHFSGRNSARFYKIANRRRRLGLKFNIEMIYLPSEMVAMENSSLTITCGKAIPWQELTPGREAAACAADIRQLVYNLSDSSEYV